MTEGADRLTTAEEGREAWEPDEIPATGLFHKGRWTDPFTYENVKTHRRRPTKNVLRARVAALEEQVAQLRREIDWLTEK